MEEILDDIPGATELFSWFGYWPSFHDAEIVSLTLNRIGVSTLQVYAYHMTNELDDRGYYVLEKHVHVNFRMEEIFSLELFDFNLQNVIFGLILSRVEEGFEIKLDPCSGMSGTVASKRLSIDFHPVPEPLD